MTFKEVKTRFSANKSIKVLSCLKQVLQQAASRLLIGHEETLPLQNV
jgi:hypothetical protein